MSIRVVAGIPYINDNIRRIEYSINDFEEKTKATCCFCKTPIGGLEEVSEFIAEDNFICVHCVDDPNAEGVL